METDIRNPISSMQRLFALFLIALLPATVSLASLYAILGASPAAYWPVVSDDVIANHQIRTFATAAFSSGYYSINEQPSAASFSHYGAHGPIYPMFYGFLLSPIGAPVSGPVWLHHLLISCATFGAFIMTRVSIPMAIISALVIATFWPATVMLSASMQEGLHVAIAIVSAALATAGLSRKHRYLSILAAISLLRPVWAATLLSYLSPPTGPFGLAQRLMATAILLLVTFGLFTYLAAPAPTGLLVGALDTVDGLGAIDAALEFAASLTDRLHSNISYAIDFSRWNPLEGQVFIFSFGAIALFALRKRDWRFQSALLALMIILGATMVLYDAHSYRAFRVLSAPLLFAMLVTIWVQRSQMLVFCVMAINLAFLPNFLEFLQINRADMFKYASNETELTLRLSSILDYQSSADPWCSTILIDTPYIDSYVAAIPPGYGISVLFDERLNPSHRQSAYFWRTSAADSSTPVHDPLMRYDGVSLERNPSSNCFE